MIAVDLQDHLADRRRVEVEIVDLAVHPVAEVVVDVDDRPGENGITGALDFGALHGEDGVVAFRIVERQRVDDGDLVRAGDVVQRRVESVAHLHARLFAQLADETLQREPAAERVAVGVAVRGDEEIAAGADAIGDVFGSEVRIGHGCFVILRREDAEGSRDAQPEILRRLPGSG